MLITITFGSSNSKLSDPKQIMFVQIFMRSTRYIQLHSFIYNNKCLSLSTSLPVV